MPIEPGSGLTIGAVAAALHSLMISDAALYWSDPAQLEAAIIARAILLSGNPAGDRPHQRAKSLEMRILSRLDWRQPTGKWKWKTGTEIAQDLGIEHPTPVDARKVSVALRVLNRDRHRRSNGRNIMLCPPIVYE